MDRLSIVISMFTGAVITGALAVTGFALGYYNWYVVGVAAVGGVVLAWPTAYVISRRIKREDPQWDRETKDAGRVPRPDAPEV